MTILHSGSTKKFSTNWESIFGGAKPKGAAKKPKPKAAAKKPAKKKGGKKK